MHAGTIVASNYVEMAKVLGRSFLRHHPDATFVILVVDDRPVGDLPDGIEIMRLADLDIPSAELDLMKSIYDVMELSTAVKPSLLRGLLRRDGLACYLDPDIFVYSPFDDVLAGAERTGILLTPHVLDPIPRDGCDPTEYTIMLSGIFNLGFIAVGRAGLPFLDWWHERLVFDAVVEIDKGLFTDQRWVDWVPALFDYERCGDPGMNIAWWNVHERDVRVEAGREDAPTVGDHPVRFVHFSGYDPKNPDDLSKHHHPRPRTAHEPDSAVRRLAEVYGATLTEQGHTERRHEAYQWSESESGLPLRGPLRRLIRRCALEEYLDGVRPEDMKTPFAFGPTSGRLRAWLEEIDGGTAEYPVTRAERQMWVASEDLRWAFRDIDGPDAAAYRLWLRTDPRMAETFGPLEPALPDAVAVEAPTPRGPVAATALAAARRGRHLAGRIVRSARRRLQA